MYTGPFYFHQPGSYQHLRTDDLLRLPYVNGAIIAPSSVRNNNTSLKRLIDDCQFTAKPFLIDSEQYNPSQFAKSNSTAGTELLLDVKIANDYVYNALNIQRDYNSSMYLIPNFESKTTSPNWFKVLRSLCQTAQEWAASKGEQDKKLLLTVSLYASEIANVDRCKELVNQLSYLRDVADGYYLNIINIDPFVADPALLKGILHLVFRLKWGGFEVVLSKAGPWALITFPVGLDIFGNDGTLAQQQNRPKRIEGPYTKSRGGPHKSYKVWVPTALSYVKYPDEAQQIYQALDQSEIDNLFGANLGFAPPSNTNPDDVYSSKQYSEENRLNHFCAHAGNQAALFRGKTLNERVHLVQKLIADARQIEYQLGGYTGETNRGKEKDVWLTTFNNFIDTERDDLEDLFS